MHPLLGPLEFLTGAWEGEGRGLWSDDFRFADSLEFTDDGRPLLHFRQVTHLPDGTPSHGEVGYLLAKPDGLVHMTIAEPSGITEALSGRAGEGELTLESVEIGHTPGTDNVTGVRRRYGLEPDGTLVAEVAISVNSEPLAPHTRSVLTRRDRGAGRG